MSTLKQFFNNVLGISLGLDNSETERLPLSMSKKFSESLDRVAKQTGAGTKVELIRGALAVIESLADHTIGYDSKVQVVIKGVGGEAVIDIVMPWDDGEGWTPPEVVINGG